MEPVSLIRSVAKEETKFSLKENLFEIRLEDIPKEVLMKYGLVIDEEEMISEEDEDDEAPLIIDESICKTELSPSRVVIRSPAEVLHRCTHKKCQQVMKSHREKMKHESLHCLLCTLLLPDSDALSNHMSKHCVFHGCLDLIETQQDLLWHQKTHQYLSKPFQCQDCKRRFRFYHFSKKHMTYCKVARKLHTCTQCNISFRKVTQLEKHVAKHVRAVKCIDCTRSFSSWKVYSNHLEKRHFKMLTYRCSQCPRIFLTSEALGLHTKCHDIHLAFSDVTKHVIICSKFTKEKVGNVLSEENDNIADE